MDENSIEAIKANKNIGKFSTGFLTAIAGYILNIILVVALFFMIDATKNGTSSTANYYNLTWVGYPCNIPSCSY